MEAKIKVLYIAPFPKYRFKGGINYIAEIVKADQNYFAKNNVQLSFFNSEPYQRKDNSIRKLKLTNFSTAIRVYFKLLSTIRKEKPDSIYLNTSAHLGLLKDVTIINFLRPFYKGKIALHIHFAEFDKVFINNGRIKKYILGVLKKKVDKIVVLSENFRNELAGKSIAREKIHLLYNFHDYDGLKVNFSEKDSKLRLIFLGSIDKRKGILDLLQAMKKLQNPMLHLDICGTIKDESIASDFNQKVKELNEQVTHHGYTSGSVKMQLLLDADILILPSYGEGLPIVILEGFATGNAIIATNVGAIPEIISDDNGILYQAGDNEKLVQSIESLHADRMRLSEIKKNNLEYAKRFSKEIFYQKLIQIVNA